MPRLNPDSHVRPPLNRQPTFKSREHLDAQLYEQMRDRTSSHALKHTSPRTSSGLSHLTASYNDEAPPPHHYPPLHQQAMFDDDGPNEHPPQHHAHVAQHQNQDPNEARASQLRSQIADIESNVQHSIQQDIQQHKMHRQGQTPTPQMNHRPSHPVYPRHSHEVKCRWHLLVITQTQFLISTSALVGRTSTRSTSYPSLFSSSRPSLLCRTSRTIIRERAGRSE